MPTGAQINKVDISQFQFALRAYKAATKKDEVAVLNRAGRNVAFRCAQFTKKGRPAKIRADLMRSPRLRYALTSIALRKKGTSTLKAPQFQRAVDSFVARRMASANYLRAGWAKAIIDLGGTFRGSQLRDAGGFGNKAMVTKLLVEIVNTTKHVRASSARGAEAISMEALQKSLAYVAADMINYSRELMGFTAKKFSG